MIGARYHAGIMAQGLGKVFCHVVYAVTPL